MREKFEAVNVGTLAASFVKPFRIVMETLLCSSRIKDSTVSRIFWLGDAQDA